MSGPRHFGPPSVADLAVAEQFVLWALRTRLEGAPTRSRLEHGFRLARDHPVRGAALASFEAWFQVLATHCWRDLYLHRAPCPCLSDDERDMLDLVASAQADDEARMYRIAAGLVHPRAIGLLQQCSCAFAAALLRLDLSLCGSPAPRQGNRAAYLH
ncbi:MAG TPA: hypothetical protein VK001_14115 [Geminicoccaceae bacterium]|nr:hypothetical protein [Geminicoccaceae bacterium]